MTNITKSKELLMKISEHCENSMQNKEYSNLSKLPYKVMTFVNSMNWRMKECGEAALLLLESDYTHPVLMLIRSTMENAAIIISLTDVIDDVIERKNISAEIDKKLMLITLWK